MARSGVGIDRQPQPPLRGLDGTVRAEQAEAQAEELPLQHASRVRSNGAPARSAWANRAQLMAVATPMC